LGYQNGLQEEKENTVDNKTKTINTARFTKPNIRGKNIADTLGYRILFYKEQP
jgi:hypothetical protein